MGGSDAVPCSNCAQKGVYGIQGTAAAGNVPSGRYGAVNWSDSNGNLWMFGGFGSDSAGQLGLLNDLWKFDPSAREWTWVSGSDIVVANSINDFGQPGVYGTLGTPAAGNVPGGRETAAAWVDAGGHLWLFGGYGFDSKSTLGILNDLWEFDPSSKEWTWMGGSDTLTCNGNFCGVGGVYGTLGAAAASNQPGSRDSVSAWTDSSRRFWLFGGYGFDASASPGDLNDLWVYDASKKEWTWMDGSNSTMPASPGVYGTLGTAASGNIPGVRNSSAFWTDSHGAFWLFGGSGYDALDDSGTLNDLWTYRPGAGNWTWMGGSSTVPCNNCGVSGTYGTLGTGAVGNMPGARSEAANWITANGHLWLFGGRGYAANGTFGMLNDLLEYAPGAVGPLPAATPQISLPSGGYSTAQTITLSDATTGATIYYTTDGSTPTTQSAVYTTAIAVSSSLTLQAIATAPGFSQSAVAGASYILQTTPAGITIEAASITLSAGATTGNTSTVTVTPVGGFGGAVTLTAALTSGPSGPFPPTFSFGSTSPVTIAGGNKGTATLIITTTAPISSSCSAANTLSFGAGAAMLACLLLFGLRRRRRRWLGVLPAVLLFAAVVVSGCGGGSRHVCTAVPVSGTTPGAYVITVTGTSGSITSTGTLTLTVN